MSEIARQLRAQIPWSTDPDWLERMARQAEYFDAEHSRKPTVEGRELASGGTSAHPQQIGNGQ
jgi:hypothetical protein